MAKRKRKSREAKVHLQELVVVTFAEDTEQAREYEALLKTNDIPAMIKERKDSETSEDKGIAVVVPEEFFDEAQVIVESQDAYNDFYDFSLDDDLDFDSEFLDDDF